MKARRTAALIAALAATATLITPIASANATTVRPHSFIGHEEGFGPTLDAAIHAAKMQMYGDYVGCKAPFIVVDSGQLANGTWWADVDANGCTGYR